MLTKLARAKVNLALHVTGQRDDGYHLLDSLVAFADIGDRLTFTPADQLSLVIEGPYGAGLDPEGDNLVIQAAEMMGSPKVAITLEKNLPVASGIGGGSADAAATLLGLAEMCDIPLPDLSDQTRLGADVPVCVAGHACRMKGIGEVIEPLSAFGPFDAILANPNKTVSTPAVFKHLTDKNNSPIPDQFTGTTKGLSALRNDLQGPAIETRPEIAEVLAALTSTDAELARMSGSGATCFGLYPSAPEAVKAAETLRTEHPDWWVQPCRLN
ncbi:MAG: 4-(cytidine 5'-diphospho)-2-C-methyl-D-erythritol kinase [Pseudomonadota bacterium]